MRLLVAVLATALLSSACGTSSSQGCDDAGASCPMTVGVEGERYSVGCLPGGVREDLLGASLPHVTYEPDRADNPTVEARAVNQVDTSEAIAVRFPSEGLMCGYEDSDTWLWAMAPDLSTDRADELAELVRSAPELAPTECTGSTGDPAACSEPPLDENGNIISESEAA